jgi:hypothetical protein
MSSCNRKHLLGILSIDKQKDKKEEDDMSTLLTTATAIEDNVLDAMKMAEDVVIHIARTVTDGFEPIVKLLPELPLGGLVPAPAEAVDHTFGFVDRLVVNVRDFAKQFIDVLPIKAQAGSPRTLKSSQKAQAA